MHPTTRFIIVAACALAAHTAGAQQVWRCGSSYSQQPCPGGAVIDTSDGRSAAQAAKSSSVAQADMKLADRMEKERLEREKNAPKALVIGPQTPVTPPPAPKVAKKKDKSRGKAGVPDVFTAVASQPAPPKKAARKKKTA
jgi:hypothetical protein